METRYFIFKKSEFKKKSTRKYLYVYMYIYIIRMERILPPSRAIGTVPTGVYD